MKQLRRCAKCNGLFAPGNKRRQTLCWPCLIASGPDIKISVGTYKVELYSSVTPLKTIKKVLTAANKKSKEIENESDKL